MNYIGASHLYPFKLKSFLGDEEHLFVEHTERSVLRAPSALSRGLS